MNNICSFFSNSRIHDYEIGNININYICDYIDMEFTDEKKELHVIRIEKFVSIEVLHEEKWGSGKYVVSSDVVKQDGMNIIEIQLNSGDKCIIKFID